MSQTRTETIDLKPVVLGITREELKPVLERLTELERVVKENQAEIERLRAER